MNTVALSSNTILWIGIVLSVIVAGFLLILGCAIYAKRKKSKSNSDENNPSEIPQLPSRVENEQNIDLNHVQAKNALESNLVEFNQASELEVKKLPLTKGDGQSRASRMVTSGSSVVGQKTPFLELEVQQDSDSSFDTKEIRRDNLILLSTLTHFHDDIALNRDVQFENLNSSNINQSTEPVQTGSIAQLSQGQPANNQGDLKFSNLVRNEEDEFQDDDLPALEQFPEDNHNENQTITSTEEETFALPNRFVTPVELSPPPPPPPLPPLDKIEIFEENDYALNHAIAPQSATYPDIAGLDQSAANPVSTSSDDVKKQAQNLPVTTFDMKSSIENELLKRKKRLEENLNNAENKTLNNTDKSHSTTSVDKSADYINNFKKNIQDNFQIDIQSVISGLRKVPPLSNSRILLAKPKLEPVSSTSTDSAKINIQNEKVDDNIVANSDSNHKIELPNDISASNSASDTPKIEKNEIEFKNDLLTTLSEGANKVLKAQNKQLESFSEFDSESFTSFSEVSEQGTLSHKSALQSPQTTQDEVCEDFGEVDEALSCVKIDKSSILNLQNDAIDVTPQSTEQDEKSPRLNNEFDEAQSSTELLDKVLDEQLSNSQEDDDEEEQDEVCEDFGEVDEALSYVKIDKSSILNLQNDTIDVTPQSTEQDEKSPRLNNEFDEAQSSTELLDKVLDEQLSNSQEDDNEEEQDEVCEDFGEVDEALSYVKIDKSSILNLQNDTIDVTPQSTEQDEKSPRLNNEFDEAQSSTELLDKVLDEQLSNSQEDDDEEEQDEDEYLMEDVDDIADSLPHDQNEEQVDQSPPESELVNTEGEPAEESKNIEH